MSEKLLKGPELTYTITSTMGELYFDCAERFNNRICQIDATLEKQESYCSVSQRSVRLALELQNRGVTSEDVIVLCTAVTLDTVIPILGSFYLGAKVANLDPSLSVRHTSHLLSLVSPRIIFVGESSIELIEKSLKNAKIQADILVFGQSEKYAKFSDFMKPKVNEKEFKPVKVDINDTAIIFFSSGTTGLPKAICHSHYSFLNIVYMCYQSDKTCDIVLYFTSFYWISALFLMSCSVISGGCRIFCATMDPQRTFNIIEKYKVTHFFLTPILTYKLTSFEKYRDYDTSSLSCMSVAGTPISSEQFQRLSAIFKHSKIFFTYALTEVGIVTIFNPKTDNELIKKKNVSSGKPAPGCIIKVIDVQTNQSVGPNQKGEIYVKSTAMMKGYYKVDNPEVFDEEGFLKTGDIGYYDDDECFYIIERLKEMFKYMSWHIVPSAIEAVLLEHPDIIEAVVFGIPRSVEEGEVPAACVVLKENCQVSKEEVEEFVAARVSDYEKLRGGVIFVKELLKTPSGKVMRKEIRNSVISSL